MERGRVAFTAVVALVVVGLTACLVFYPAPKYENGFEAVVLETGENTLLVYKTREDDDRLCHLNLSGAALEGQGAEPVAPGDIKPGRLVYVRHSGMVQESFPPVYPQVYGVKVLGPASEELYEQGRAAAGRLAPSDT